jgi:hypothetical protein
MHKRSQDGITEDMLNEWIATRTHALNKFQGIWPLGDAELFAMLILRFEKPKAPRVLQLSVHPLYVFGCFMENIKDLATDALQVPETWQITRPATLYALAPLRDLFLVFPGAAETFSVLRNAPCHILGEMEWWSLEINGHHCILPSFMACNLFGELDTAIIQAHKEPMRAARESCLRRKLQTGGAALSCSSRQLRGVRTSLCGEAINALRREGREPLKREDAHLMLLQAPTLDDALETWRWLGQPDTGAQDAAICVPQ